MREGELMSKKMSIQEFGCKFPVPIPATFTFSAIYFKLFSIVLLWYQTIQTLVKIIQIMRKGYIFVNTQKFFSHTSLPRKPTQRDTKHVIMNWEKDFQHFYAENASLKANASASRFELNKNFCRVGASLTNRQHE